jgi:branched-chain amino acid transport system ATP-binding protein
MRPNRIARKGLIRTYQATKLFMELSVLENIEIACNIFIRANLLGDLIGLSSIKREQNEMKKRAIEISKLVGLEKMGKELAQNLPHGFQRILGVAIALATGPKLLCLDEPLTGMNFEEVHFMVDLIKKINKNDTTILLVEHAMKVVMSICDRVIVLNFGSRIAEGPPKEVQKNQDVIEAYLGRPEENAA